MNCATHQQTPAVAYCRTCGKPLCESCKREVRGIIYCEDCLASRVQDAPDAPGVANPGAPRPGVALALGFIPGVGAMYTGEFKKAFIHVAVFVALIVAANELSDYFAILFPFWFFYMVFDSYHTAKAKQEGRPVPDILGLGTTSTASASAAPATATGPAPAPGPAPTPIPVPTSLIDTRTPMPTVPILLIAVGVLFLLHTLGWFHFFHFGMLWPFIPLAIGGWLVWQRSQIMVCHCIACMAGYMLWPVMSITLGMIGLLSEFTPITWKATWPLLLIVFGIMKFLQSNGSRVGHIGPGAASAGIPPARPAAPSEQNEVSHG